MWVRHTRFTELTRSVPTQALLAEADSKNDLWHPSPQFIRVFDPSGETTRREGFESREAMVKMRMEAVMLVVR